jgi:hypothetical protein
MSRAVPNRTKKASSVVKLKSSDEGMANRPSIFAYLVFGPGGITAEGIARPMKVSAYRGLGM